MASDPAVQRRGQLQPNRHYSRDSAEMRIAGQYELQHTIGRGHFAVVKLARHVFTGEQVAVKVIDKAKLDSSNRESLYQEVMCMKLVQHPNVVRLYDVIDTPNKLYLILELGDGGDLYDFIVRQEGNSGLRESLAKSFFHQIVTAIAYCHRLHVCHRDLKLENCVVFERLGVVKLTDFGFSNVFTPGKYLETSCGSLAYSAPEILLGDSYDAPKVDVWSLGVILFMLVSGRLPFQEPNDSETLARIMDVRYKAPKHVSSECRSLIDRLLQRDPTKRPGLDGILADDWFADVRHSVYDERPLISLGRISQSDQQEVVAKMVDGGLATEQEILEALERDDYSYITSTFYLLAERLIKRSLASPAAGSAARHLLHQQQQQQQQQQSSDSSRQSSSASLSVEEKLRRFSMIIEEEDDDVAGLEDAAAAAGGSTVGGTPPVRLQSPQFSGSGGVGRLSSLSGLAALCDPIREEETGEGGVLQIPAPSGSAAAAGAASLSSSALFPGAPHPLGGGGGAGSSTSSQKRRSSVARESSFSLSSLASSLRSLSSQRAVVDLMRDLGCSSPNGGGGSKQNSSVFYPAASASLPPPSTAAGSASAPVASTDEVELEEEQEEDDDDDEEHLAGAVAADAVDGSNYNTEDDSEPSETGHRNTTASRHSRAAAPTNSSGSRMSKRKSEQQSRLASLAGHVNQCVTLSSEEIHVSDSGSSTQSQKQQPPPPPPPPPLHRLSQPRCRSHRSSSSSSSGSRQPQQQQQQQQRRQLARSAAQQQHQPRSMDIIVRSSSATRNSHRHRQHQQPRPPPPPQAGVQASSRQDSGLAISVAASTNAGASTHGSHSNQGNRSKVSMEKFRLRCCTIS